LDNANVGMPEYKGVCEELPDQSGELLFLFPFKKEASILENMPKKAERGIL